MLIIPQIDQLVYGSNVKNAGKVKFWNQRLT